MFPFLSNFVIYGSFPRVSDRNCYRYMQWLVQCRSASNAPGALEVMDYHSQPKAKLQEGSDVRFSVFFVTRMVALFCFCCHFFSDDRNLLMIY